MAISNCKQAINTGYKTKISQGLLIKHIQELAKTSHEFITLLWWATIDQLYPLLYKEGIHIAQKFAGKEPLGLNYITAYPFPHNCKLPEI